MQGSSKNITLTVWVLYETSSSGRLTGKNGGGGGTRQEFMRLLAKTWPTLRTTGGLLKQTFGPFPGALSQDA